MGTPVLRSIAQDGSRPINSGPDRGLGMGQWVIASHATRNLVRNDLLRAPQRAREDVQRGLAKDDPLQRAALLRWLQGPPQAGGRDRREGSRLRRDRQG